MLSLHKKTILAPMAGVTDPVYRKLCRECGADIVLTEMVSADGLFYRSEKTHNLAMVHPWERPCGIQLFGSDPERLAQAVQELDTSIAPDFFDLNAGCPVQKVVTRNGGSALLREPILFGKIIEAMVRATPRPVTVKIRAGWLKGEWVEEEFGKIAQESGAQAITLHPRSRSMGYTGKADWERIRILKETVSIPVIGNGDIRSGEDALRMYEETGCDSVMLARGTYGNPWLFDEIKRALAGKPKRVIGIEERVAFARKHVLYFVDFYGKDTPLGEMKKHLAWYFKGMPMAAELRAMVMHAHVAADLATVFACAEKNRISSVSEYGESYIGSDQL